MIFLWLLSKFGSDDVFSRSIYRIDTLFTPQDSTHHLPSGSKKAYG
jgi:hypothetical protein